VLPSWLARTAFGSSPHCFLMPLSAFSSGSRSRIKSSSRLPGLTCLKKVSMSRMSPSTSKSHVLPVPGGPNAKKPPRGSVMRAAITLRARSREQMYPASLRAVWSASTVRASTGSSGASGGRVSGVESAIGAIQTGTTEKRVATSA